MLTSILNERDLFIAASDLFLGRTKTDNQHSKLKPMEFNKRVTEALLHDIQQDDDFESK